MKLTLGIIMLYGIILNCHGQAKIVEDSITSSLKKSNFPITSSSSDIFGDITPNVKFSNFNFTFNKQHLIISFKEQIFSKKKQDINTRLITYKIPVDSVDKIDVLRMHKEIVTKANKTTIENVCTYSISVFSDCITELRGQKQTINVRTITLALICDSKGSTIEQLKKSLTKLKQLYQSH